MTIYLLTGSYTEIFEVVFLDRIIAVIVVMCIIFLGFIINFMSIDKIDKKREELIEYLNKFVKLMQSIKQSKQIDKELYFWLSERSMAVQNELAEEGVLTSFKEPINGAKVKNYHLITDFMPNISKVVNKKDKFILVAEFYNMGNVFEEAFLKHKRNLDRREERMKRSLINPLALFTYGITYIIQSPLDLLCFCKVISTAKASKIKRNIFIKIINFLIVLICLIFSLSIIILGFEGVIALLGG